MIIVGYPGIGKTTIASKFHDFFDFDSSSMIITEDGSNKKPDYWWELYARIAIKLNRDLNVFVSSHKEVQEEILKQAKEAGVMEHVRICYPALELKEQWLKRLKERYEASGLDKDKRAFDYATAHYEENIMAMKKIPGVKHKEIKEMPYDLYKILTGCNGYNTYDKN